jgi:predicted ATPase
MMLVTTRPTFQHGFGGHPIVTKLALSRLGRDQIASIVDGLARAAVEPSATSSAEMRDALDDYRRTGARFQVPFLLSLLAEASLERKNWNEGMATISEALALIEETGEGHVAPEVYRIREDLLAGSRTGDPEADYLKALELARQQGTRLFELRAAMSLAQFWADQHKRAEAREFLVPIYEWFTEGFNTSDLKSAKEQIEGLSSDLPYWHLCTSPVGTKGARG